MQLYVCLEGSCKSQPRAGHTLTHETDPTRRRAPPPGTQHLTRNHTQNSNPMPIRIIVPHVWGAFAPLWTR